ncbi:MAG: protein kinase [Gemmatimonadetes bacterium]|nr:protein kinase [Gemmatimonadota bacterium]
MTDIPDRLQRGLPRRYALQRVLKRGGMGIVYLAREEHPNRQVAIKVLDPNVGSRLGRERFLREIDLASNLTHPNIVPIFAAGEAEGLLYYVMPYVAGESLSERIAREARLPIEDALQIAYEVAGALQHAHDQDVVHRDVKPGNILLYEGHALVTDFGVARAISAAGSDPMTESGVAMGTPAYMSPEQIVADAEVDGRADVYALGIVLYEMLAGEPPFRGRDSRTVLARQMVDPVPPLRTVRDTVPPAVEQIVSAALAKTPADRISSAKLFAEAIADARTQLGSGWLTPTPTATGALPRPSATRLRTRVAVGFGILLAVALAWQVWRWPTSSAASVGARYVDSIAVMPLENLTGDTQYDHLSAGITEEIITHLTQIVGLKVISRHSVEALRLSSLTTRQLADSLGVRHILRGSVRIDEEQIRVTVQNIDARTDANLWADTYTGDLSDAFQALENIARQVTAMLVETVDGLELPGATSHVSHGPGHDAYLLGQHWLSRRTPEGLRRAIASFDEALALDPDYAVAYAGLSNAYALSLTYRYDIGVDGYRAAGIALALADRAIALDSGLAAGYTGRGYIGAIANAPAGGVVADFEYAASLQPNAPATASWSARILAKMGKTTEAFSESQRARDLDPLSASRRVGVAYWALRLGKYDMAVSESAVALAVEPELMLPRALTARAYFLNGNAVACEAIDLGPHAVLRAMCLRQLARGDEAAVIVDSVIAALQSDRGVRDSVYTDVIRLEDLATYFAWIGDTRTSLVWIERAFEQSPSGIEAMVLESALFDRVRRDAAFADAVERMQNGVWQRVLLESDGAVIP